MPGENSFGRGNAPLWLRVLLTDQLSFADLHKILQIIFGWEEEYLHEFSFQHSRVMRGKGQFTIATDYDEETDIGVEQLAGDE
ncbi:IS1096 element passenger TnpR family protein [Eisenbergiella porci]|uniref:IS1096 element passenger TnpR family protein n=1 Tax=Eisenbergiella porci TaxID=2652274 RepID=UPI003FA4C7D0